MNRATRSYGTSNVTTLSSLSSPAPPALSSATGQKTPGEAAFLPFAEGAEIRLEEELQRRRSGVARVVGLHLADPVRGVCHSVSWTIRPLRLRPARSRRPG